MASQSFGTRDNMGVSDATDSGAVVDTDSYVSVSSESSSRPSRTGNTRVPQRNISRERRKAEIALLGKQAVALERELSQLLACWALAKCKTPSTVWRSLARRQLGRRLQAEDENQRLRQRLLFQLELSKTLEALLRNRKSEPSENGDEGKQRPPTRYPVDDLAALHDQCMNEIDDLYSQVDTVFKEESQSHAFGRQPLVRTSTIVGGRAGDKTLCVDTYDTSYAPFPYNKVCDATWRAITTEYVRQNRVIELFRCTEDEYTSKFKIPDTIMNHEQQHSFSATVTIRKFKEAKRMVLVWVGLDVEETAVASSIYTNESGWLVAEPAKNPETGEASNDGTVIRVSTRRTPVTELEPLGGGSLAGGQGSDAALPDHGAVASHLLMVTESDIASMTEAVENILLDEAIGSSEEGRESVVDAEQTSPSDFISSEWQVEE